MNEKDTIAIYEYFEHLGYSRELIRNLKEVEGLITFTIEAFGRVLISGRYVTKNDARGIIGGLYATPTNEKAYFVDFESGEFQWHDKRDVLPTVAPVRFGEFRPTMPEIHERIFNLLSDKHQADDKFLFRMRSRNNKGRYEKGYWFLGNDDYIVLSFWAGQDWKNKTPYIWIGLNIWTGIMWVQYVGRTDDATAAFLENLASVNGLEREQQRKGEVNRWHKTLFKHWQGDYIKVIEKFIQTEKVIIDTFLKAAQTEKQDLGNLDFLDRKDFNRVYNRIQKLRQNRITIIDYQLAVIDYQKEAIQLKQLTLSNIGCFVELKLDISPRVICIFGENGIGKTTVLRALLLALTGVDEVAALQEDSINNRNLQRLMRIQSNTENGEIIYEPSGKIELSYIHGAQVHNLIEFQPRKNDSVEIREVAESEELPSFTATLDDGLYTQLIIGFAQVHGRKSQTEQNEKPQKNANVQDILPLIYDIEDNRFENLASWIIDLYADAKINDRQSDLLVLQTMFQVVSEITEVEINFKKVNFKEHLIWVDLVEDESEPQRILFSLLSQGYKNVFAWVGHFVKRLAEANNYAGNFKECSAIVLIDEIDTYLHPLWQRNILNVLAKTFINTQFIVTTHSPLVANHLNVRDKAVYIIQDKGAVEKVKHIQGVNLKDAFHSWMGIPYRDAETNEEINELFKLINSGKLETARINLEKLEQRIGKDGDLVRAATELKLSENFDSDFNDADFDFDN